MKRRNCHNVIFKICSKLTLVLTLAHHVDGDGTQNKHVHQASHCHSCHRQESVEAVLRRHKTREAKGLSAAGGGQSNHYWQCSLQREVDGEDGGLETRKLRPRECTERDESSDK